MSVSATDYRRALGSWPSGVTVVTVSDAQGVHGITVSAFISVSLDPPLVLISIGNAAAACTRIPAAGAFMVNVLSAGQDEVSNHFSGRQSDRPAPIRADGSIEGALAVMRCTLHQTLVSGDHTLFVGLVESTTVVVEGDPLIYWRGRYRTVSD